MTTTIYEKLNMIKDESLRNKNIYLYKSGFAEGVPHTLEETAQKFGLKSRQRVHQIYTRLYQKLRMIEKTVLGE